MTEKGTGQTVVCLLTASFPPYPGGVARAARRLAGHLLEGGYLVHVVTYQSGYKDSDPVSRIEEDGLTVHRIAQDQSVTGDLTGFRLRKYLKDLDTEVDFGLFHGFFLTVAYSCVLASAGVNGKPSRPTILSARGTDAASLIDEPTIRSMFLYALGRATWVTSVNQEYLDRIQRDVELSGRCSVIRNGVARASPDSFWSQEDSRRRVIGTVGEFRTVKDIPLLIRAYAALPQSLRRGLLLAGYFSSREEELWSQMLIDEFHLRDEVEITGPFDPDRLEGYLGRMYVYVQSSSYEGLPNALLEAASHGLPLVATAVGGVKEVFEDERSALLVPHGEPAAMSGAIRRVLEDPSLAKRLARGALEVAEALSLGREKEAWLALYDRLLSREHPPQSPDPAANQP